MAENSPYTKVIAAFGSDEAVAKAIRIPSSTVYSWGAPTDQKGGNGRIPAKHQGPILAAAKRLRLPLSAADLIDMRHVAKPTHVRAREDVA